MNMLQGGAHYEFIDFKHYNWPNSLSSRFISQLILSAQYLDLSKISNFLDVGVNNGESFHSIKKMGCNPKCYAIEINEEYKSNIQESIHEVLFSKDEYLALDKKYHNFFDLIFLSHTLEHFNANQLSKILSNLFTYLTDDGILMIEVPNDDFRKFDPELLNQSPHLSFFSKQSLEILLKKYGFEILYINTVGMKKNDNLIIENLNDINTNFIKLFFKRIRIINIIYQYVKNYFIKWIKINYKYYTKSHGRELISSLEFIYGTDRDGIRLCARKDNLNNL